MMETAAFLASSWSAGSVVVRDCFPSSLSDTDGLDSQSPSELSDDLSITHGDLEHCFRSPSGAPPHRRLSCSCDTSVASSECSDELSHVDFDIGVDGTPLFPVMEDNDYLNHMLANMLETASSTGSMPVTSLVWEDDDDDDDSDLSSNSATNPSSSLGDNSTDIIPSAPSSPQPLRKRSQPNTLLENKPWSHMSHKDQLSVVESLSEMVSHQMGIREQVEVIRIINPSATVSPTDTQFVIDLKCLNEEKLHRLREYIKQHCTHTPSQIPFSPSQCQNMGKNCQSPSVKKQTKKQRQAQQKEARQRQRKAYQQMMKEKRSGLFHTEQLVSLSVRSQNNAVDEDEVDILT